MKKLMILAVLMTTNVWAGSRTILKDSKKMQAEVNHETVICSAKGYGLEELKINIKALDGWTILDHSNLRFGDPSGLPCMTAGMCKGFGGKGGFSLEDVIQNNPRVETIVVERELIETRDLVTTAEGEDPNDPMRCQRTLTEKLNTVVGGIKFAHSRTTITSEQLPKEACEKF